MDVSKDVFSGSIRPFTLPTILLDCKIVRHKCIHKKTDILKNIHWWNFPKVTGYRYPFRFRKQNILILKVVKTPTFMDLILIPLLFSDVTTTTPNLLYVHVTVSLSHLGNCMFIMDPAGIFANLGDLVWDNGTCHLFWLRHISKFMTSHHTLYRQTWMLFFFLLYA